MSRSLCVLAVAVALAPSAATARALRSASGRSLSQEGTPFSARATATGVGIANGDEEDQFEYTLAEAGAEGDSAEAEVVGYSAGGLAQGYSSAVASTANTFPSIEYYGAFAEASNTQTGTVADAQSVAYSEATPPASFGGGATSKANALATGVDVATASADAESAAYYNAKSDAVAEAISDNEATAEATADAYAYYITEALATAVAEGNLATSDAESAAYSASDGSYLYATAISQSTALADEGPATATSLADGLGYETVNAYAYSTADSLGNTAVANSISDSLSFGGAASAISESNAFGDNADSLATAVSDGYYASAVSDSNAIGDSSAYAVAASETTSSYDDSDEVFAEAAVYAKATDGPAETSASSSALNTGRRSLSQLSFSAEATAEGSGEAPLGGENVQTEYTYILAEGEGDNAVATVYGESSEGLAYGNAYATAYASYGNADAKAENVQDGEVAVAISTAYSQSAGEILTDEGGDALGQARSIAYGVEESTAYADAVAIGFQATTNAEAFSQSQTNRAAAAANVYSLSSYDSQAVAQSSAEGEDASAYSQSGAAVYTGGFADFSTAVSVSEALGITGDAYATSLSSAYTNYADAYALSESTADAPLGLAAAQSDGTTGTQTDASTLSESSANGETAYAYANAASNGYDDSGAFAQSEASGDDGASAVSNSRATSFDSDPTSTYGAQSGSFAYAEAMDGPAETRASSSASNYGGP